MIAKRTPLNGMTIGSASKIAIRELPGLHTIDLRVVPGSAAQVAIVDTMGLNLPAKPGQISYDKASESYALCLAPDWWLVVGLREAVEKLGFLKDQFHFSVVNVSRKQNTIELEGPHAREILAH